MKWAIDIDCIVQTCPVSLTWHLGPVESSSSLMAVFGTAIAAKGEIGVLEQILVIGTLSLIGILIVTQKIGGNFDALAGRS